MNRICKTRLTVSSYSAVGSILNAIEVEEAFPEEIHALAGWEMTYEDVSGGL